MTDLGNRASAHPFDYWCLGRMYARGGSERTLYRKIQEWKKDSEKMDDQRGG